MPLLINNWVYAASPLLAKVAEYLDSIESADTNCPLIEAFSTKSGCSSELKATD